MDDEKLEEKTFPFELKEIDDVGIFEGYAAVFGKKDRFGEIIEKGAFKNTLKEKKILPLLWYHDPRNPIGIVTDIMTDDKGLKIRGQLNLDVQTAREKYSLMKQKAIRGLSFGYRTVKDLWEGRTRTLLEVNLFEVSPCTFQMQPKALVTSVKQWDEEKPFPNEHSARIKSPDGFDPKTFRRTKDGTIYGSIKVPGTAAVIWGKLKGAADPSDNPIPQSIRFPTENWTVAQAKAWLKDNDVKYERFESASKSVEGVIEYLEDFTETKSGKMVSAANMKLINDAMKALTDILKKLEPLEDSTAAKPADKKSLIDPIIKALEIKDKPQCEYLFDSIFKVLEN